MKNIAFVGCGNMAGSLIKGLLNAKRDPKSIWATALDPIELKHTMAPLGVQCLANNRVVVTKVDTVVLAVKPHQIKGVCKEISTEVQAHRPLIVSVAAGIKGSQINEWLGGGFAVVRSMPNTPCAIGAGVTALLANQQVTDEQKAAVKALFETVGSACWVDDDHKVDVVTAVAGSGPAYVFLFMEALQQAAIAEGLEPDKAKLITEQLMLGAARMAIASDKDIAQLRHDVTSPGGSTEQALKMFEQHGFCQTITAAFNAARERAAEMSNLAGKTL